MYEDMAPTNGDVVLHCYPSPFTKFIRVLLYKANIYDTQVNG